MSKKSESKELSIDKVIENTFDKLKNIIDANTVVGKVISVGGVHVLPISKISMGIVSGGGNLPKKNNLSALSSSGFNIVPIGFITISESAVNYLPVNNEVGVNKVLDGMFKIYDGIVNKMESEDGGNEEN